MQTPAADSPAYVIKTARLANGISIRRAARYAEISDRTMSRIENGQRLPTPGEAQYLADLLNVNIALLLTN